MKKILCCSICGHKIEKNYFGWSYGNSSYPINNGRCCDYCNIAIVLPRRIYDRYIKNEKGEKNGRTKEKYISE